MSLSIGDSECVHILYFSTSAVRTLRHTVTSRLKEYRVQRQNEMHIYKDFHHNNSCFPLAVGDPEKRPCYQHRDHRDLPNRNEYGENHRARSGSPAPVDAGRGEIYISAFVYIARWDYSLRI